MLLEVGSQVDILLRNGNWVRNMQVLGLLNNTVTVKTVTGPTQQSFDMVKDVAVIVKSSLIQL